jgi:hypothetical protein
LVHPHHLSDSIADGGFFLIALVVLFRGFGDLR